MPGPRTDFPSISSAEWVDDERIAFFALRTPATSGMDAIDEPSSLFGDGSVGGELTAAELNDIWGGFEFMDNIVDYPFEQLF